MTEQELREHVVAAAKSYLGCKVSDGSHKKIIDLYNSQNPLPVGYKVQYTDAWCATFVSAVGVKHGLTDIILPECSCERMIALYKKAGRWMENDAYTPQIADIIMYDWQDNGSGDDVGFADHVGFVAAVNGDTITVIEGNLDNSVGYRTIKVNGRYIRGYCLPDYAAKATPEIADMETPDEWAKDACDWCVKNGLFVGSDGRFNWKKQLTRQDAAVLMHRAAQKLSAVLAG